MGGAPTPSLAGRTGGVRIDHRLIPLLATAAVWAAMCVGAGLRYDGFFSARVLGNLLQDNAFLGLAAIGMTFVILSGGIDLSVGAMIGLVSILTAVLIERWGWSPWLVVPLVLAIGGGFGLLTGLVIAVFELPPFLVTLAGMFLLRGLGFVVSLDSVGITHPLYERISLLSFEWFPVSTLTLLLTLAAAIVLAHHTRFGRTVYAIGDSEASAVLMGLPVLSTKIRVYGLSGLCAAMGGVVSTLYMGSGHAERGTMLELDAIAAVVIGGTPLSGGVGYVFGTLLGVMIFGTVRSIITFEGTLSTWWARIAIGVLLLGFLLLQKLVHRRATRAR